ncbi:lysozyme-like domain-containing protein [Obelidium mucronatum]|nr:lysozyme-like domain-containing protein [Obelidium mucronatum]
MLEDDCLNEKAGASDDGFMLANADSRSEKVIMRQAERELSRKDQVVGWAKSNKRRLLYLLCIGILCVVVGVVIWAVQKGRYSSVSNGISGSNASSFGAGNEGSDHGDSAGDNSNSNSNESVGSVPVPALASSSQASISTSFSSSITSSPSTSASATSRSVTSRNITSTTNSTSSTTTLATTTSSTTTTTTTSTTTTSTTTTSTTTTTTEPPPSPTPPPPPAPKSGTIAALISQSAFDSAVSTCTGHWGMYSAITSGYSHALPGGLPELALLLGNMAWESGGFSHTKEQACQDGSCAYGWYYGRGYIQLTWQANYQAAADFLGRPEIASNPDLVSNDEYTNWQVVEWYWSQKVGPVLQSNGYSIGASVKAINGGIECGGNVWGGRISYIQCFANQFGTWVDPNSWC